jgi:hypothetical protein
MSEIENMFHELYKSELEALLQLCEFRRIDLSSEIDSPKTAPERRVEAIKQRDDVMIQWAETMTKLAQEIQ